MRTKKKATRTRNVDPQKVNLKWQAILMAKRLRALIKQERWHHELSHRTLAMVAAKVVRGKMDEKSALDFIFNATMPAR